MISKHFLGVGKCAFNTRSEKMTLGVVKFSFYLKVLKSRSQPDTQFSSRVCLFSFINPTSHFQARKSSRFSGTQHVQYFGSFSWRAIYTLSTRQPLRKTRAYLGPCQTGP